MTTDDLDPVWERIAKLDALFMEPSKEDERLFKELMVQQSTVPFILFEGALAFFNSLIPSHHAFFNGIVWDERLYGRRDVALDVLNFGFKVFDLQKVTSGIPADNHMAANYAKSLGFKPEGCIRNFVRRGELVIDFNYFGLTREEMEHEYREVKRESRAREDSTGEGSGLGLPDGRDRGGATPLDGVDPSLPWTTRWRRYLGRRLAGSAV